MNRQDWQARLEGLSPMQRQMLAVQLDLAEAETGSNRGEAYIAAYVAADQFDFPDEGELRAYLAETLPDHMVPARFIFLDALPKTPNGKIDRQRLPAPELFRAEDSDEMEMPSTSTEKAVAEIWKEVLDIPLVGLHDDFFELGGHSLLVTLLISRLRTVFEIDLPINLVFEESTIFRLARYIDNVRWVSPDSDADEDGNDREEFSL